MTRHRLTPALLLCGLLAASASPAQAQELKRISIGHVAPTASNWTNFVAIEKRFFQREGLQEDITYVGNVANTVQQLVGGSFDVAVSTFDTAIRAVANGGNVVLIGSLVVKYPYSIMTAPDIARLADLKGKRVILPFEKDLLTVVWNRWVTEQGMRPAEIEQIYAGATPNRLAALANGSVQAALLTQPFDFRAAAMGYKKLLDIGAYAKDYGFLTLLARPQWLRDHGDMARGYIRALSDAVDWLYDPANKEEAIAILARGTKLDLPIAVQCYQAYIVDLQPFSRKLAVPEQIVRSTVKTLIELGDIKPDAASKNFVDLSYLPK